MLKRRCLNCGLLVDEADPKCWTCGHPTHAATTAQAPLTRARVVPRSSTTASSAPGINLTGAAPSALAHGATDNRRRWIVAIAVVSSMSIVGALAFRLVTRRDSQTDDAPQLTIRLGTDETPASTVAVTTASTELTSHSFPVNTNEHEVRLELGGASVTIEPGGFVDETVVSLTYDSSPLPGLPPGVTQAGPSLTVESDSLLAATALVQLPYDEAIGLGRLAMLRVSDDAGPEVLESTVDGNFVSAATAHFTTFLPVWIASGVSPAIDWVVWNSGLVLTRTRSPECSGAALPTWVGEIDLSQDRDSRLRWCAYGDGDDLVVRIRNNRPYSQILFFPEAHPARSVSQDPVEAALALLVFAASHSSRLTVGSGQQIDVYFSEQSDLEAQSIEIVPIPELISMLAAHAPGVGNVVKVYECASALAPSNRDTRPAPDFAMALEDAIGIVKACASGIPGLEQFLLAHSIVTSLRDFSIDVSNTQPQIFIPLVGPQTEEPQFPGGSDEEQPGRKIILTATIVSQERDLDLSWRQDLVVDLTWSDPYQDEEEWTMWDASNTMPGNLGEPCCRIGGPDELPSNSVSYRYEMNTQATYEMCFQVYAGRKYRADASDWVCVPPLEYP